MLKLWFCRDDDGDVSVWINSPELDLRKLLDGIWCSSSDKYLVTATTKETFEKFGEGFRGVRKGRRKLIDFDELFSLDNKERRFEILYNAKTRVQFNFFEMSNLLYAYRHYLRGGGVVTQNSLTEKLEDALKRIEKNVLEAYG